MRFISLTFLVLLNACTNRPDIDAIAMEFSDIECRAIILKDKRFDLSEKLRAVEKDSIIKKYEIDSLNDVINVVKAESLVIADSIKARMEFLFEHKLRRQSDRIVFLEKLKEIITKRKCHGS